jgi:hypothetical protein
VLERILLTPLPFPTNCYQDSQTDHDDLQELRLHGLGHMLTDQDYQALTVCHRRQGLTPKILQKWVTVSYEANSFQLNKNSFYVSFMISSVLTLGMITPVKLM